VNSVVYCPNPLCDMEWVGASVSPFVLFTCLECSGSWSLVPWSGDCDVTVTLDGAYLQFACGVHEWSWSTNRLPCSFKDVCRHVGRHTQGAVGEVRSPTVNI
jgi:hypothetical protein